MNIDFGDEFVIKSYRIPWLIWIQILVLLLLFLLLCFSSVFATNSDPFNPTTITIDSKASSSTTSVIDVSYSKPFRDKKVNTSYATNRLQHSQTVENQSINGLAETSASRRRVTVLNPTQTEISSAEDTIHNNLHPCNYIRLAKIAFLKCLGIDPSSETSWSSDRKRD